MNPKGCNPPSISWDITAAVVWSEVSVSIISLLVGSKYPSVTGSQVLGYVGSL